MPYFPAEWLRGLVLVTLDEELPRLPVCSWDLSSFGYVRQLLLGGINSVLLRIEFELVLTLVEELICSRLTTTLRQPLLGCSLPDGPDVQVIA